MRKNLTSFAFFISDILPACSFATLIHRLGSPRLSLILLLALRASRGQSSRITSMVPLALKIEIKCKNKSTIT